MLVISNYFTHSQISSNNTLELLQIVIGPLCGHYFCNRKEIPQEHIRDDFSNTLCYFLLLGQTQIGPLQRLLGGLGMCYIYHYD